MNKQGKILYGGLKALGRELSKEEWQDAKYTILLDENTFQHCLPLLISTVEALQEAEFVEVPVGEECKTLEVAAQIWQTLLEGEADRNHVLVNLGGGTISDLGGYVAAGYKRGIRHINVPTTLLGMVDAAIGGKTAIDFGGVKNSIGHFYPAAITTIEPAFLDTLPDTEIHNGRMEMVKTAAVTDPTLFQQLLSSLTKQQITSIARLKARNVKADPYDHSIRKILNFGHTFGHAIELHSGLPHGVAVGIGMKVAMYLSTKKTGLAEEVYISYSQWLEHHIKLPRYTLKDVETMLSLIRNDKKNTANSIRCVLLQELGAPIIDIDVSENEIRDAFLKTCR